MKSKAFDFLNVIKYVAIFLGFLCLNKLEETVYPYSTALLSAFLANGGNFISSSILYLLSFLVLNRPGLLASGAIVLGSMLIITLIRLRFKSKNGLEYGLYTAISLVGFLFLGDTSIETQLTARLLCMLLSSALSFVFINTISALENKGLKYKMNASDYVSIILFLVTIGVGVCNLISPFLWKAIIVFLLLISAYFFNLGVCVIVGGCLAFSLAFFYGNVNYVGAFALLGLVCQGFSLISRYLGAISIVFFDYLSHLIFGVYEVYDLSEFLPVVISCLIFCILPNKLLSPLKEQLSYFNEKALVRQTINRNRTMLSNRLFELSAVFTEMANAFDAFKKQGNSPEKIKETALIEIQNSVCKNCDNFLRCENSKSKMDEGFIKMLDIGLAKGKLTLIDMPSTISNACIHPQGVIYCANKFLAEYRNYKLSALNLSSSRAIIAKESEGVAEILKGLALDSGTLLKYQSKMEKRLRDELLKKGFFVSEILVYGEEKQLTVSLILNSNEFSIHALQKVIGSVLCAEVILYEKNNITEDKVYLAFKKRVEYDAVFGVARVKKDGSQISGDTHSVLRISDEKFIVALSDGMGSGEEAETVSRVSLSLIESFYKAGMNSNLILNTVNKLLSINTEDSFTALDVAVINLKERTADFIKYGAPYGFIINEGSVKIIEASTLPLGILEDLSPSVAQTEVFDGDMLVLLTDGISDAFGSSSSIIDFLRTVPAKNPQTLANQILAKAVSLNGGKHLDDMTALTVRIFKNS